MERTEVTHFCKQGPFGGGLHSGPAGQEWRLNSLSLRSERSWGLLVLRAAASSHQGAGRSCAASALVLGGKRLCEQPPRPGSFTGVERRGKPASGVGCLYSGKRGSRSNKRFPFPSTGLKCSFFSEPWRKSAGNQSACLLSASLQQTTPSLSVCVCPTLIVGHDWLNLSLSARKGQAGLLTGLGGKSV